MIEDLTRTEYDALLRQDFPTFVARCFHQLNPQTDLAMNGHLEVIAAKLAAVCRQAGRKDLAIPRPDHDAAAIAGKLVGEILGIADTEDLHRRVEPETPGRKGDRGHQRFEVTRWQIDDQPLDLALTHLSQLGGNDLEMPVWRKRHLRVELGKTALSEIA